MLDRTMSAAGHPTVAGPGPALTVDDPHVLADADVVTLLRQATYWRTRDRDGALELVRLDELDPGHLARILAWLRGRATQLREQAAGQLAAHWKAGRLDDHDFAAEHRQLGWSELAEVWLDDTPLVRRLVELAPRPLAERRRRLLPARLRGWRR